MMCIFSYVGSGHFPCKLCAVPQCGRARPSGEVGQPRGKALWEKRGSRVPHPPTRGAAWRSFHPAQTGVQAAVFLCFFWGGPPFPLQHRSRGGVLSPHPPPPTDRSRGGSASAAQSSVHSCRGLAVGEGGRDPGSAVSARDGGGLTVTVPRREFPRHVLLLLLPSGGQRGGGCSWSPAESGPQQRSCSFLSHQGPHSAGCSPYPLTD